MKIETNIPNSTRYSKDSIKKEFYYNQYLHKKKERYQVSNWPLNSRENEKQIKPKITRREEVTKFRAAVDEIKTRKK